MATTLLNRRKMFVEKFKKLNNSNEFVIIDEFVDMRTKIKLKHKCGNIIEVLPKTLFRKENKGYIKCKCNKSIGRSGGIKKTNKQFVEELYVKNKNVIALEEYVNSKTKISFRCKKCDFTWKTTPDNVLNGLCGCPNCANNIAKNTDIYKKEILDLYGNEYEIIGEYVNARTPILTKHTCGYIWSISPDNLKRGKGCPICHKLSKGEYIIYKTLEKYNINYKREYSFPKSKYRFDFAIFDNSNNLKFIFEYDGIQHFYPQDGLFGGIEGFNNRIRNDLKKDLICKKLNVQLIRIPYLCFCDLENTVINFLIINNIL